MTEPVTATRTRRRWTSFSLRSLFVLITVIAIGTAWVASERRQSQRELQVAQQLKAADADIQFTGLFDAQDQKEQSWWRRALGSVVGLRIQSVSGHSDLTDFAPLADLKSLTRLSLSGQASDLSPLAGLKNLQTLRLGGTRVSEEQIKVLQQALPNCKIVR